jgi:hypothetical protein
MMDRGALLLTCGGLALTLLASGPSARAQEGAAPSVSGVTVPRPIQSAPCSQDQASSACAAARLDQAAKQAAATAQGAPAPQVPVSPASAPITLGVPTPAAISQQYGPNFGKSVTPYRPPAPQPAPAGSPLARKP